MFLVCVDVHLIIKTIEIEKGPLKYMTIDVTIAILPFVAAIDATAVAVDTVVVIVVIVVVVVEKRVAALTPVIFSQ
ncbi:hypothetical protein BG005_011185 [Podila minutissima]|nr:hypothetical protein BG005_011185 [Podila minutissima]